MNTKLEQCSESVLESVYLKVLLLVFLQVILSGDEVLELAPVGYTMVLFMIIMDKIVSDGWNQLLDWACAVVTIIATIILRICVTGMNMNEEMLFTVIFLSVSVCLGVLQVIMAIKILAIKLSSEDKRAYEVQTERRISQLRWLTLGCIFIEALAFIGTLSQGPEVRSWYWVSYVVWLSICIGVSLGVPVVVGKVISERLRKLKAKKR